MTILYEDNHLIVVVKPQNVPSQEDITQDESMLSQVKKYIKENYNKPGNVYVGLVHRLDRPTGGVMVFAKTSKCASRLSEQIKSGTMTKKYLTVVEGMPREKFTQLTHYLKKNTDLNIVKVVPQYEEGAKKAVLNYNVLADVEKKLSLIDVDLITGRSHQIRVQMSTIGTPVFADKKYGAKYNGNLALWAYKLTFEHPTLKKKMTFVSYPPENDLPWKYFNLSKFINN